MDEDGTAVGERWRWEIRADGPDGIVDHFYAETDIMRADVVLAEDYDALAEQHGAAVEALRRISHGCDFPPGDPKYPALGRMEMARIAFDYLATVKS